MSTLVTANLTAPGGLGGAIQVDPNTRLVGAVSGAFAATGMVIQTVINQSHNRTTYSSPGGSSSATAITDMNLTITPKRQGSIILCEWRMSGEINHDNVWVIMKNGSLVYNGYNLNAGNSYWSGYHTCMYDGDDSSTPSPVHIMYWDSPNTTSAVTYAPGIRSANGSGQTFCFNRTYSSTGQWNYENGMSVAIAMEIAV